MTVAFVHNQALPYRHFLFEALAGQFDIDWFFFNQRPGDIPPALHATLLRGYHMPKASDYWLVPGLGRRLRAKPYDLIVGGDLGAYNTAVAYRAARAAGVPFVPWIEEWDRIHHPRRTWRRGFEQRLLGDAAAVIVAGVKQREYLLGRGVPADKLVSIPNALPFDCAPAQADGELAAELGSFAGGRPLVVSIGRHVAFKGHGQLLRAQALLERRDAAAAPALVIAGDGPLLGIHRELARAMDLQHIHFIERFVNDAEKRALYQSATVFVLASTRTRAFEAWGLVCNEALACGKPMVVSDAVGAAGEVVRDGANGLIFADGHPEQLAEALARLLADSGLRKRFADGSVALQADYAPTLMIDRFANLLRRFQP
jgi:glycosyltransferase involved in cell wall biosynthesis